MTEIEKKVLMDNMTENLQMLRVRLGLSQNELASMIGISRHTIMNIENKKSELTWANFLALVLIFTKNESTNMLLNVLGIYTDEFNDFVKQHENEKTREK